MLGSLTVRTIAHVGENLHLLVMYGLGILMISKFRSSNRNAFKHLLIGFILLVLALFISGFTSAWNDLHNFADAYNAKEFSQTLPYILSGGIAFISTIVAWVFMLFGIAKALKCSSPRPSA
jgi:hypothetical protein